MIVFVQMFKIVNVLTNSSQRISLCNNNLLAWISKIVIYFAIQLVYFRFKALFTKNSTSQVSVVRLREVSVLQGV